MEEEKENKLRELLKKADLDAPSPLFTDKLLLKIEAEAALSEAKEPALRALLQQYGLEKTAPDFTKDVLKQIAPPKTVFAPIIPNYVWYMVATFLGALLVFGLYFPQKNSSGTVPRGVKLISFDISKLASAIPDQLLLGALAICVLLVFDYLIRYGKNNVQQA
ncbi:hypothetical protein [Runella sp. SP2]|uniref:hypothetical protein n=1 Tax=Runella sp. SP2 TaxID=2268026 RepID=UPI000F08883E|nr:hypothetical protein [Runella sp. SP2]AYQ32874.1 hypothetical protein DTQ70_12250 [Runella sp. SP2]